MNKKEKQQAEHRQWWWHICMHSTAHTTERTRKLRARKTRKTFFLSLQLCHVLSRRMGSYSILFDMEKQHGKCSHAEHPLFILISYTSTRLSPKNSLIPSELCLMRRIECGAQLKQKKLLTNFVHLLNYTFTFIQLPLEQLDMSRYVHTLSEWDKISAEKSRKVWVWLDKCLKLSFLPTFTKYKSIWRKTSTSYVNFSRTNDIIISSSRLLSHLTILTLDSRLLFTARKKKYVDCLGSSGSKVKVCELSKS